MMEIGKRDIEKMLGYHAKGSNPDVLARTVKDLNKAKARAVIASAMGWNGCSRAFIKRCKELGATDADIAEVERMCDTYELPEPYRSQFDQGPKLADVSLLRDWFPKFFKILRDHDVQNIKVTKRVPSRSELEKDRTNGRCWTLAYTVSFDHNGKHYDWNIANHTNEGGGSYGVSSSSLGAYFDNQQTLADLAASELDRLTTESVDKKQVLREVHFLDKYKKDEDDLQSILKDLGLVISGVEGHWRIISKKGKDSAVAFSDRDIPFVLMDQEENVVNKSGNPTGARLFLQKCLSLNNESIVSRILAGGSVRSIIIESVGLTEDDQEYWDYVHNYGSEEEREKAADYFDVSPSAFDETYSQFYELEDEYSEAKKPTSADLFAKLKELETSDYQNRGSKYPDSGEPDTIDVFKDQVTFTFKNTPESEAERFAERFLKRKGFKVDRVTSSQTGDYLDDWVDATAFVSGFLNESCLTETRKFKVGETFTFKDRYGVNHYCTVLDKKLFDEMDYDDYAIGTITFSFPTMGEPHKETARIYKSEQGDSYGDEYFISDRSKTKNGFGIASWAFPNR